MEGIPARRWKGCVSSHSSGCDTKAEPQLGCHFGGCALYVICYSGGGVGMSRLAMVAYELMLLHSSSSKSEMSLMTASELGSGYLVEQHLHKGVNVDVRGKNTGRR